MKKIIESQIFVLSKTNKVSVPIQICYTNDDVEITVSYNDTEYCAKGKDHLARLFCGSAKKTSTRYISCLLHDLPTRNYVSVRK